MIKKSNKDHFVVGTVPLEKEFRGIGAIRSVVGRLLHSAARYLPMHPRWRVAIHRWRGVKIGKGVFIGSEVFIDNTYPQSVTIEDNVSVASGAFIVGHFIVPMHLKKALGPDRPTRIGVCLNRGCYVGPRSVIMDGVTIGEFSVIGAGTIVTKDIPAYSIAVGNPARIIRSINPPDVLEYFQKEKDNISQNMV